eukprot:CFRG0640T1
MARDYPFFLFCEYNMASAGENTDMSFSNSENFDPAFEFDAPSYKYNLNEVSMNGSVSDEWFDRRKVTPQSTGSANGSRPRNLLGVGVNNVPFSSFREMSEVLDAEMLDNRESPVSSGAREQFQTVTPLQPSTRSILSSHTSPSKANNVLQMASRKRKIKENSGVHGIPSFMQPTKSQLARMVALPIESLPKDEKTGVRSRINVHSAQGRSLHGISVGPSNARQDSNNQTKQDNKRPRSWSQKVSAPVFRYRNTLSSTTSTLRRTGSSLRQTASTTTLSSTKSSAVVVARSRPKVTLSSTRASAAEAKDAKDTTDVKATITHSLKSPAKTKAVPMEPPRERKKYVPSIPAHILKSPPRARPTVPITPPWLQRERAERVTSIPAHKLRSPPKKPPTVPITPPWLTRERAEYKVSVPARKPKSPRRQRPTVPISPPWLTRDKTEQFTAIPVDKLKSPCKPPPTVPITPPWLRRENLEHTSIIPAHKLKEVSKPNPTVPVTPPWLSRERALHAGPISADKLKPPAKIPSTVPMTPPWLRRKPAERAAVIPADKLKTPPKAQPTVPVTPPWLRHERAERAAVIPADKLQTPPKAQPTVPITPPWLRRERAEQAAVIPADKLKTLQRAQPTVPITPPWLRRERAEKAAVIKADKLRTPTKAQPTVPMTPPWLRRDRTKRVTIIPADKLKTPPKAKPTVPLTPPWLRRKRAEHATMIPPDKLKTLRKAQPTVPTTPPWLRREKESKETKSTLKTQTLKTPAQITNSMTPLLILSPQERDTETNQIHTPFTRSMCKKAEDMPLPCSSTHKESKNAYRDMCLDEQDMIPKRVLRSSKKTPRRTRVSSIPSLAHTTTTSHGLREDSPNITMITEKDGSDCMNILVTPPSKQTPPSIILSQKQATQRGTTTENSLRSASITTTLAPTLSRRVYAFEPSNVVFESPNISKFITRTSKARKSKRMSSCLNDVNEELSDMLSKSTTQPSQNFEESKSQQKCVSRRSNTAQNQAQLINTSTTALASKSAYVPQHNSKSKFQLTRTITATSTSTESVSNFDLVGKTTVAANDATESLLPASTSTSINNKVETNSTTGNATAAHRPPVSKPTNPFSPWSMEKKNIVTSRMDEISTSFEVGTTVNPVNRQLTYCTKTVDTTSTNEPERSLIPTAHITAGVSTGVVVEPTTTTTLEPFMKSTNRDESSILNRTIDPNSMPQVPWPVSSNDKSLRNNTTNMDTSSANVIVVPWPMTDVQPQQSSNTNVYEQPWRTVKQQGNGDDGMDMDINTPPKTTQTFKPTPKPSKAANTYNCPDMFMEDSEGERVPAGSIRKGGLYPVLTDDENSPTRTPKNRLYPTLTPDDHVPAFSIQSSSGVNQHSPSQASQSDVSFMNAWTAPSPKPNLSGLKSQEDRQQEDDMEDVLDEVENLVGGFVF